jgi:hypothetical protein
MKVTDQRQYDRFQVPRTTFVALWPHYVKAGQVKDISMGGLCFCHDVIRKSPDGLLALDIFLAGRAFYLYKVPFEMVWDLQQADETHTSANLRRCGLRFGELTPGQKLQLDYFIQTHATGKA